MTHEPAPNPRALGPVATLALSAFGLGLSPVMPGTVGSLGVVVAMWLFPSSLISGLALLALLFVYGVVATLRFANLVSGPDAHGDPGWVVSDEVAGQALACLPVVLLGGSYWDLGLAFVLFRVFDIWKPGPVGRAERIPGARGVLLDDLVAAVLALPIIILVTAMGWLP